MLTSNGAGAFSFNTPTVTAGNVTGAAGVTAGSSKVALSGTPTGSVLAAFGIDINEANILLQNLGGALSATQQSALALQNIGGALSTTQQNALNFSNISGTVDVTTQVAGVLPVANGGTGLATIPTNSIIVGNGTGTPTTLTGTAGQILSAGAGGAPAYSDPNSLFVFRNGLSESAPNEVLLGGTLDQNTNLGLGAFTFSLSGFGDF